MPKLIAQPLSYYVNRLKNKPFSFVRYQDGDFNCITGTKRYTGSHSFFSDMTQESKYTLTHPHLADNYIYATPLYGIARKYHPKTKWHFSPIFAANQRFGNIHPLILQIRKMETIVVGSKYLRPLKEKTFSYKHFIEVPFRNCWTEQKRIEEEIRSYLTDGCLVSFSAGTLSNILIYRLYSEFGDRCFMIDFGSVWDLMCNHINRGDWRLRIAQDSTWVQRIIEHALGKNGSEIPFPNPVYIKGDDFHKSFMGVKT